MEKLMGSDANYLFPRMFVILGIPSITDEVHGENAARQWQFVLNLIDTYKTDILGSGMNINEKFEMQIFLDSEHFLVGDTSLDMIRNQLQSVNAGNKDGIQVLTFAGIFNDVEKIWTRDYVEEAIFITFNPQNPIRQLLCDFSEPPEYSKKYYCDYRTSERVRNWLSKDRYQSVDFTNDEVLGKTKLFLAKGHESRNPTPSPGSSSTHMCLSPKTDFCFIGQASGELVQIQGDKLYMKFVTNSRDVCTAQSKKMSQGQEVSPLSPRPDIQSSEQKDQEASMPGTPDDSMNVAENASTPTTEGGKKVMPKKRRVAKDDSTPKSTDKKKEAKQRADHGSSATRRSQFDT
ncbi:hypothetical protein BS50DRAFT_630975 [Corynespora cassiicola Philippines]|uniref:Uncharacterized protein n=1 Tax=Corynespora cassiicola Philippines TaxID=1448308 RepID=A0A2T2NZU0_CORCC|nr:hypothetical protein BS50DRAFT_630975 [Corynespora cassiicola Philippines]